MQLLTPQARLCLRLACALGTTLALGACGANSGAGTPAEATDAAVHVRAPGRIFVSRVDGRLGVAASAMTGIRAWQQRNYLRFNRFHGIHLSS